jgi:hypothetical protein
MPKCRKAVIQIMKMMMICSILVKAKTISRRRFRGFLIHGELFLVPVNLQLLLEHSLQSVRLLKKIDLDFIEILNALLVIYRLYHMYLGRYSFPV